MARVRRLGVHTTVTLDLLAKTVTLEADSLDSDEARGSLGLETSEFVHGGELLVVEHLVGLAALNGDITLVQGKANLTVDSLLAGGNAAADELALGAEEETVVQNLAELGGDNLVAYPADFTVEGKTFKVDVCCAEDGCARAFVAATRLDTDESVLDNVNTTDAVGASERVEGKEHVYWVGVGLAGGADLHGDGNALLESDGNVLWLVGCSLRRLGQLPHVGGRRGVLK